MRTEAILLFLWATAHLHFDLLFASLQFGPHSNLIPTFLGEASWGAPSTGNQIHSNILTTNHTCRILSYCVSAKLYSGNQAPPLHLFKTVFTECLPYVLRTFPGIGNSRKQAA